MLPTEEAPISAWLEPSQEAHTTLQAAQTGLAWLKEHGPTFNCDWTRIDADLVSISSFYRCPLAQAGGSRLGHLGYATIMERIHGNDSFNTASAYQWAITHGFNLSFHQQRYVPYLNLAWVYILKLEHIRREQAT